MELLPYKDIKKFILVRVDRVIFASPTFGFAVQPFLYTASKGKGQKITNNDHDHSNEDRDEDGRVVEAGGHWTDGLVVRGQLLVNTVHVVQGSDGLAQVVVSHAADGGLVGDLVPDLLLEHEEVVEEVALAAPEVIGETETGQDWVGGQLPDGKIAQKITIKLQQCQFFQVCKRFSGNAWKKIFFESNHYNFIFYPILAR